MLQLSRAAVRIYSASVRLTDLQMINLSPVTINCPVLVHDVSVHKLCDATRKGNLLLLRSVLDPRLLYGKAALRAFAAVCNRAPA